MPADDSEEELKPKKPETKKVQKKPGDTGKTKKLAGSSSGAAPGKGAPAKADDDAKADEKPKKGTGKVAKPLGKSDGKPGGKPKRERAPGPPPPPPATRGPVDYALAVLAPLLCAGLGAYGFLLIKGAIDLCKNPILIDKFGDPLAAITKALDNAWVVAFPPAPIIAGVVIGLLATLCFLKMAPGMGARLMGVGVLAFGLLGSIVFVLAGQQLQAAIHEQFKKCYAAPRGGDVDPQTLSFRTTPEDFAKRQLLSTWKVDLDDGEIPLPWIAAANDQGLPSGDKVPPEEEKIKFQYLRIALIQGRELAQKKQVDEALWAKIQELRDKANKEIDSPSEATTALQAALKGWDARAKSLKPAAPKAPWFLRLSLNGDFQKVGNTSDDEPWSVKYYLGKAIHKAVKELPADMLYAGCFRCEVNPDAPVEPLTKYDFVWLCYDLQKTDRAPVLVPHIKGLLDEARFRVEVLGEK